LQGLDFCVNGKKQIKVCLRNATDEGDNDISTVACQLENLYQQERHKLIIFESVFTVAFVFSTITVFVRRWKQDREYNEAMAQRFT